ncbi:Uncharacterised protein [Klebsiella pneumoniae]|nr:Uncharacterised protein [Klebsiella pneumoniae]
MRYWLLVILMNVLFWLIVKHVAPEWYGSPWLLCRPNHLHTNSCGHHMA